MALNAPVHGGQHEPRGDDPIPDMASEKETAALLAVGLATKVGSINPQIFFSSGTYTKPANLLFIVVRAVGGGGGGGGAKLAGGAGSAAGGGGGSGGYSEIRILAVALAANETVTIGAAGAAGANTGANGGAGGTTSFGAFVTPTGGAGGTGHNPTPAATDSAAILGGVGGVGAGGDTDTAGAPGSPGLVLGSTTAADWMSGSGGSSYFGGGGIGHSSGSGAGNAGLSFGGGGGGAVANSVTGRAGGAGFKGVVIVEEYLA